MTRWLFYDSQVKYIFSLALISITLYDFESFSKQASLFSSLKICKGKGGAEAYHHVLGSNDFKRSLNKNWSNLIRTTPQYLHFFFIDGDCIPIFQPI